MIQVCFKSLAPLWDVKGCGQVISTDNIDDQCPAQNKIGLPRSRVWILVVQAVQALTTSQKNGQMSRFL